MVAVQLDTHGQRIRKGLFLILCLSGLIHIGGFSPGPSGCAQTKRPLALRQSDSDALDVEASTEPGIRINKVFKATHSRRQADDLISSGRVTVNGQPVTAGQRVVPFQDEVLLDGEPIQGWEALNAIVDSQIESTSPMTPFEYTKYWKPAGVICTTDRRIKENIIDALLDVGYSPKHRIYPVGRLDRDTSGLILLTSDGRLPNAALRGEHKQPKTYEVSVDKPIGDSDLDLLRDGVVITTVAQRDGNRGKPLTAKTRPCIVDRLDRRSMRMTITEGRNRQIRKMVDALGYRVQWLERVAFAGMELAPLNGPGEWKRLDESEMKIVGYTLDKATSST